MESCNRMKSYSGQEGVKSASKRITVETGRSIKRRNWIKVSTPKLAKM